MARKPDAQKQITAFASAHAGFTLASQTDSLALANSTRDLDLVILDFVRACPTQRDRSRRSVQRFFQCNHDVGLDICPTLRSCLASTQSPVRFVDFLKFFLSSRLVLGNVGMMLARQLAKSAANLVFAGRLGHTQGLVIISELYGHSLSSLCLRSIRATF